MEPRLERRRIGWTVVDADGHEKWFLKRWRARLRYTNEHLHWQHHRVDRTIPHDPWVSGEVTWPPS